MRYDLRATSPDGAVDGKTEESIKRLTELDHIPHTLFSSSLNLPTDLTEPLPGYLSTYREDMYLYGIDQELGIANPAMRPVRPSANGADANPGSREFENQNPNSVTNWLRRNQPDVFLQEKEAARLAETASQTSSTHPPRNTKAKRGGRQSDVAMVASNLKTENDADDDVSFVADGPGSSSSRKRKADGDDTYRPKGGGRGKRKREDGPAEKAPRKKGRASAGGSATAAAAADAA